MLSVYFVTRVPGLYRFPRYPVWNLSVRSRHRNRFGLSVPDSHPVPVTDPVTDPVFHTDSIRTRAIYPNPPFPNSRIFKITYMSGAELLGAVVSSQTRAPR